MMLTVELESADATLADVKERFGLSDEDIDDSFGVVSIDPAASLYAILVNESVAEKVASSEPDVSGPFSNPKIEAFGPARSTEDA